MHCEVLILNKGIQSTVQGWGAADKGIQSTVQGWGAADIEAAYNLPSSTKGSGQIIAIVVS